MIRSLVLLFCCTLINAQSSPALVAVAQSNSKFSQNFAKVLSDIPGNLVSSPLSAHLALAMTQLGAGGNTATIMSKALHLPENKATSNEGFKQLNQILQNENSKDLSLKIANRLYLQSGYNVNRDFVSTVRETFDSEPQDVDFINPNTRVNINKWVEQVTQNKIKDLIKEGILESHDTKALLVNTIYFNGKWIRRFTPENKKYSFHQAEGEALQVNMMSSEGNYKYAAFKSLSGTELVMIPLKGSKVSLVILLPVNHHLLPEVEKKMQTEDLNHLINSAQSTRVNVIMPKFIIESTIDLKEPTTKMGMGEIYTKNANFSGISSNDRLYVSNALQKTILQVNEKGVEASSATYVAVVLESAKLPSSAREILVKNPFLFYIVHQTSEYEHTVLFNGRVTRP